MTCIPILILIWRMLAGIIHIIQLYVGVILLAIMARGRGRSGLATHGWRLKLILSAVSNHLDRSFPRVFANRHCRVALKETLFQHLRSADHTLKASGAELGGEASCELYTCQCHGLERLHDVAHAISCQLGRRRRPEGGLSARLSKRAQHAQHAAACKPVLLSFAELFGLLVEHGSRRRMLGLPRLDKSLDLSQSSRSGLRWKFLLSRVPAEVKHHALAGRPALNSPVPKRKTWRVLGSFLDRKLCLQRPSCMADTPVDLTSGPEEQLWSVEQELQEVVLHHLAEVASAAQLLS